MALFRRLIAAIAWAMLAAVNPRAAVAEMAKTADPNETDKTLPYSYTVEAVKLARATKIEVRDFNIIYLAAARNKCHGDNFLILLAIRKAEHGRPGLEFGIMHPKCSKQMAKRPGETLDIQAGWAAATITKNRVRWERAGFPGSKLDGAGGFIFYLADRYCPAETDPAGNLHFKSNVSYWFKKLKGVCDGNFCEQHEKGKEKTSNPGDHPRDRETKAGDKTGLH